MCLPSDVEDLTLDQIFLLVMDEKRLERIGGVRQTSLNALQQEGLIPKTGGGSLVQRIRAAKERERQLAGKLNRKQRRRERRQQLIEYKRQEGR